MAFNLGSLAFLAVAGFAINVLIGRYYGPSDLGIFNIVFSLFIFVSQLGSFGIQYSTLRYAALTKDATEQRLVLRSAIEVASITSSAAVVLGFGIAPLIGAVFDLGGSIKPWLLVLPGLWCFCLNKVFLAFLNGIDALRSFAIFQSCRYLLLSLALLTFMLCGFPGNLICVILTASEVVLLLLLVSRLAPYFTLPTENRSKLNQWRRQHVRFGAIAMPSGVMAELNTRVDTLLVAAMLGSYLAGIYTIAILLAEGLGQIVTVVRNVANPMLAPIISRRDQPALTELGRSLSLITITLMALGGAIVVAAFPYLNSRYLQHAFGNAYYPLIILVVGQIISSPMMVFSMVLNQGGRPDLFTLFMTISLIANVVFNIVGIWVLGLPGASAGTVAAYIVSILALNTLCYHAFGLRLAR